MELLTLIESLKDLPVWVLYIVILGFPFVQEDAAVLGAAALTAMGTVKLAPAVAAIFVGLVLSDIWKYWIGWAALKNKKGAALAQKDKVQKLKDNVQSFPFATLMMARFVPLTRIPAYVACGFFKVSYLKFCFYVAFSAALYVAIVFTIVIVLGTLMAEHLKWALPIFGLALAGSIFAYLFWKKRRQDNASNPDTQ